MSGRRRQQWAADMVRGAARFARWRQGRERGARIPAELWQLAVELALRYGVSRTASALRVGYYALKKRVETGKEGTTSGSRSASEATFVELPAFALSAVNECTLEFEKSTGAKLRVHMKGPAVPDLTALVSHFWESR